MQADKVKAILGLSIEIRSRVTVALGGEWRRPSARTSCGAPS